MENTVDIREGNCLEPLGVLLAEFCRGYLAERGVGQRGRICFEEFLGGPEVLVLGLVLAQRIPLFGL